MRVLQVTPWFFPAYVYGGPIASTYELCRNLVRSGADVRVLTTDANGLNDVLEVDKDREVSCAERFRVRYCRRRLRHSVSPDLLLALRSYVSWADVVHLYAVYSFPTLPTLLCSRLLGKPVVWSPLGALQRWEHSRRRGLKAIWDAAWFHGANLERTVLAFASEAERQGTLARFPRLRTDVMPHGVEIPSDLVHSPSNGELRFLFLGRLDPIKGIEALLEACKIISEGQGFRWSLTIAGTGAELYVAGLRRQVAALGLETRVHMVGEVVGDAKKRLLENSDVVVVPSHAESFGLVVAEALAHGVPVIASKYTPWCALEEKGCGLWVENDPRSLADAICRVGALPLQEMGERGREWMRMDFSWQLATQKMMDLYSSLMP